MSSAVSFNLDQSKILSSCDGLKAFAAETSYKIQNKEFSCGRVGKI